MNKALSTVIALSCCFLAHILVGQSQDHNPHLMQCGSVSSSDQLLSAIVVKDLEQDWSGQFAGLGIVIALRGATLTIVASMENTPAQRAGLQSGDTIVEIDGESTHGITLPKAIAKLRGLPGSTVRLRIQRTGSASTENLELSRALIVVPSIKDTQMLDAKVGYTRITKFNTRTPCELQDAIDSLKYRKAMALILDLRNNPGGLLCSAIEISQKFLPEDAVIATLGRRDQMTNEELQSKGTYHNLDLPMVILVNRGTGGAAELMAAALQEQDRAILLGESTFGMSAVQRILPLVDDESIRLTTAHFYTPNGNLISDSGLEPDVEISIPNDEWLKIMLARTAPIERDQSQIPKDRQLEKARSFLDEILTGGSKTKEQQRLTTTKSSAP